MESGFTADLNPEFAPAWERINHRGSGRFEFFKARIGGVTYFVKQPDPAHLLDPLTNEALEKEYALGKSLEHPYLVKYFALDKGAMYEEFVDGLTLREMIDQSDTRIREPEFIEKVCRQLLEATAYLHSHGILHNDIKPENVMITRIGEQVKLIDLGCASSGMWETTAGFTPRYRAPEQDGTLTESSTGVYTDLYLVGQLMKILSAQAGVREEWKPFIGKATCSTIKLRFNSDHEAMEKIPKNISKKGKWRGCLYILGIIILVNLLWAGLEVWLAMNLIPKIIDFFRDLFQ